MALAAVMLLSAVTGCGASAEGEASVQSVSMICGLGSTGLTDRFAGMVTAQSETQIKKNDNATVDAIKVKVDQEVKKGDPMLKLDLDYLSQNAPSIVSPVLCTELEDNQRIHLLKEGQIKAGEPLFEVEVLQ